MSPTIDIVAEAYFGSAKIGKLNIDENGATKLWMRANQNPRAA
jgi:hypothetical protein